MPLRFRQFIDLPPHTEGGFDHADVHPPSGKVYVAHTALGQVEIIDGEEGRHLATVSDCPEASGVLYAPELDVMVAAARGAGRVLLLEASSGALVRTADVGPKPNGLAWDPGRCRLLVADVQDFQARLLDPTTGEILASTVLPGRPRWCVYDPVDQCFWVNIREPAGIAVLGAATGALTAFVPVASAGPHGLALDEAADRLFVACDSGDVLVVQRATRTSQARVPIGGEPDVIWLNTRRQRLYLAMGHPGLLQVLDTQTMVI
ncbi:MAG TPA: hypothetical protein VHB98_02560, partial [Chloroflexota bacterium]|nr:hypothetical protein [Chloroflexota bacterium]